MVDIVPTTSKYSLPLPPLSKKTWHDYWYQAMRIIEALIATYTGVYNVKGVWNNSLAVQAGELYADGDEGVLYRVLIDHTTPATGTFAEARAVNPTYWSNYAVQQRSRGNWATNTRYYIGDFVASAGKYATCINEHTSGSTFDGDAANWIVLIDLTTSSVFDDVLAAANTATVAATNAQNAANDALAAAASVSPDNLVVRANNLSDLLDLIVARTNIGLGTASDVQFNTLEIMSGATGGITLNRSGYKLIHNINTLTADRTITWQNSSGTAVLDIAPQTLSNKTLGNSNIITVRDDRLTIQDDADTTKQVKFDVSPVATGATHTLTVQNVSGTVYVTGGQDISIADGGTGASDAATARTNLGATTVGNALFTAADASAARTTIAMYSSIGNFTAPQRGALSSVAYAASITLDLSTSNNFDIGALTGALTLNNPTNQVAGQSGIIFLTQDGVGGRLITYGSNWLFEGGVDPALSTSINAKDALFYFVHSSGNIYCTLLRGFA